MTGIRYTRSLITKIMRYFLKFSHVFQSIKVHIGIIATYHSVTTCQT